MGHYVASGFPATARADKSDGFQDQQLPTAKKIAGGNKGRACPSASSKHHLALRPQVAKGLHGTLAPASYACEEPEQSTPRVTDAIECRTNTRERGVDKLQPSG